jgi:TonB-dependent SusC/RagA subfamily outer membrane receptor
MLYIYKRMKVKIVYFLVIIFVAGTTLSAQNNNKKISITGLVVDQGKNPVAKATIFIDGEMTSQATDDKGYYKIKIKAGSTRIGIFTISNGIIEEAINGRTTINFILGSSSHQQNDSQKSPDDEETINVGYGSVKKKDLTQTVSKMDGGNNRFSAYTNIYELIKGEFSGVKVIGKSINIQGSFSLYASTEPLFVVDGVPRESIENVPPQMVKSIEVLKGASATIYGTRGACGVILITLIGANDM